MNYKIFISHSSIDTWVAEQIENQIVQAGASTFLDSKNIQSGDDFEEIIFENLEDANELLVLLTPWAVGRDWINIEIGAARVKKMRIVPVLYNVLPDDLKKMAVLNRKDFIQINEISDYFSALKTRIKP